MKTKAERYPHAAKYITAKGIRSTEEATLHTWEYEASICSKVEIAVAGKDAVGALSCPECHGYVFRYGDIRVDYHVPFVSIFRIQLMNPFSEILHTPRFPNDHKIQCLTCRRTFK